MTTNPSNPSPDESRLNLGRVLSIGAFVVVAVFAGSLYLRSQSERRAAEERISQQTNENMQLQTQMANLETALADLKAAKVYEQQEQAISKSNAISVLDRGDQVRQQIQQLQQAQERLTQRISTLESSDEGRRIASDWNLVERASAALNINRPADNAPRSLITRLDGLLSAPQQAIEQQIAGYVPGDSLLKALTQIETEAQEARRVVEQVLADLNAIVRQSAELPVEADRTFSDALASLEEVKEQQRRELISQTVEDAKLEAARRIAAQEAENQRLLAEAEIEARKLAGEQMTAKIIADALAEKQRADALRQEQEMALAKANLEKEFARDQAEIRRLLVLFLADGTTFRGDGSTKGPASLRDIQSTGVMREGRRGLEALSYAGTFGNDRPRGPIPFYDGSEEWWRKLDKEALGKAQGYLIKYGDLMVEKGLLAP